MLSYTLFNSRTLIALRWDAQYKGIFNRDKRYVGILPHFLEQGYFPEGSEVIPIHTGDLVAQEKCW